MILIVGGMMSHTLHIRKPAVAGTFYPDSPSVLKNEIGLFLDNATKVVENSPMVIVPHAGYVFSAPVAASSFQSIKKDVKRVILIGPSHYKYFKGISIPHENAYETPLGVVPVDSDSVSLLKDYEFVNSYNDAHDKEHCLEVQIPFLQTILKDFTIVPIIVSKIENYNEIAKAVLELVDDNTIIVISSDLSHYMDNHSAHKEDSQTIERILQGDPACDLDACGSEPIKIAMTIAKIKDYKATLLDMRNSFETAPKYGSEDRVVGYAAIAYLPSSNTDDGYFSEEEKLQLLKIARESLISGVTNSAYELPDIKNEKLKEVTGCFVTLRKGKALRGCVGYIEGVSPLYKAIADNAVSAALKDYRFPPVAEDELDDISLEVSVLTKPESFDYNGIEDLLLKITPGVDGIILDYQGHRSTFLPQVWDELPDKIKFLEHLSRKAGLGENDWQKASYRKYQAIHFEE